MLSRTVLPHDDVATSGIGFRRAVPFLAALAILVAGACVEEPGGAVTNADPFEGVDADFIDIDYESALTREGVRVAWVDADSSYAWDDSTSVLLFGMVLALYDSVGAPRARITSASGRLNTETQQLLARGSVVMQVDGRRTTLQSEMLEFFPNEGMIRSDSVTRAVIDGSQTSGTCFESDMTFENVTVCDIVGDVPPLGFDTTVATPGGAPPRERDREGRR